MEPGMMEQRRDIGQRAGTEIINDGDLFSIRDQGLRQMRANKTSAAGNEDTFHWCNR